MALPKIFVIVWEDGGHKDRHGQDERKENQLWSMLTHRLALLNYTCAIASLCLKWFGFCYLPNGKKKKVEKRLTFDNLCNIFTNLPCPTEGPFPGRRKFIRSESFKSLPQGQGWKCCRGERTSALGHNNFHFSSSMSDGLCHKKKMLALCYLTQLNWGCDRKINAVCSKRPTHTDAQGYIPRDIRLHTRESKVTSCLDDVSRTFGQGLSVSRGKVLDPMGVLGLLRCLLGVRHYHPTC